MRCVGVVGALLSASVVLASPDPKALQKQVLEVDAWGLAGAEMNARATVHDPRGGVRELAFSSRSRRYAPPLSKSLVRFTAPADVAGVGFLQIEHARRDDDRFLFLPELKKSRRIVGGLRGKAFMGTDFSYGDLDRKDFRESVVRVQGEARIGKFPCWKLEAKPTAADALYGRMEVWVRQDNSVPLKWVLFDRAGKHVKTLETHALKRVGGRWFITRSVMTNHAESSRTELNVQHVAPREDLADETFTVRELEKA